MGGQYILIASSSERGSLCRDAKGSTGFCVRITSIWGRSDSSYWKVFASAHSSSWVWFSLMKPLRLTTYLQCRIATSMLGVILVVVHDTARTKRFVITRRYGCPLNQWVHSSLCYIPRLSFISRGLSEVTAQVCREGWAPKSESIRCWDWVHATE